MSDMFYIIETTKADTGIRKFLMTENEKQMFRKNIEDNKTHIYRWI